MANTSYWRWRAPSSVRPFFQYRTKRAYMQVVAQTNGNEPEPVEVASQHNRVGTTEKRKSGKMRGSSGGVYERCYLRVFVSVLLG